MLFNSLQYLIFYPIVVLFYFLIPKKVKNMWLLIASYYFYMGWNAKYIILLLFTTIVTYTGSLLLERYQSRKILFLTIFSNFAILFYFKYAQFAWSNIESLLNRLGVPFPDYRFDILLPVGISFFTFQAVGYTIDVYRKEIYAERNFFRYALFVSFFPQLVAGPIERSKNLLKQLDKTYSYSFNRMKEGLLLILWGFFLKLVIADRAAIFVDTVFSDTLQFPGVYILVATILFAFQIYCDFSGYSIIAMGSAKIIGFELVDNFNAPYFSQTIGEFWRRWHVSLSSWFRDYLYIPLGGSKKGIAKTYINLLIVFIASGLWHGAAWTYIAWGCMNGLFQVFGRITKPFRQHIKSILSIQETNFSHRLLCTCITFCLIDFTWFFFRFPGLRGSISALKNLYLCWNPWILFDNSLFICGLDYKNFYLLILSIFVLLIADSFKYRGIKIRNIILQQDLWFRCLVFTGGALFILMFGIWGGVYDAKSFIYFQF